MMTNKFDAPPLVISRREAARRLGLSVPTIDRLIRRGEIQAIPFSRRVLIPVEDVERFLEALRLASSAKPNLKLVAAG